MSKFQKEMSLLKNENMTTKNFTVFKLLANHISELPSIHNFVIIGEISYSHEGQDYFYEVNCRLNNSEHIEEIELLFNDITRTKIKEKENAEYKYKSLYFSKVIHEFKNPLICMCEIINQTQDLFSLRKANSKNLVSNLEEINSLANYMQILIKDFTHLAESQYQSITDYQKNETDLYSTIDFCNRIAKTLLKKNEKNEKIEYKFIIDKNVPDKILTDEWKLKQTIINLLSNSIKFTFSGSITLELSLDEQTCPSKLESINFIEEKENKGLNRIKFLIKDTGIGMKEEIFKDLSKPFKKEKNSSSKKSNEFGSGLGLSIANEMSLKLGSGLECETKLGEGTSFWFFIPLQSESKKEISKSCNEPVLIIESNSCPEEDILNDNKFKCQINNDKSICLRSNKSFSTRKLNNLNIQKPVGIYSDFLEISLDNIIDNSEVIITPRSNLSLSTENEKEKSNIFKVKINYDRINFIYFCI